MSQLSNTPGFDQINDYVMDKLGGEICLFTISNNGSQGTIIFHPMGASILRKPKTSAIRIGGLMLSCYDWYEYLHAIAEGNPVAAMGLFDQRVYVSDESVESFADECRQLISTVGAARFARLALTQAMTNCAFIPKHALGSTLMTQAATDQLNAIRRLNGFAAELIANANSPDGITEPIPTYFPDPDPQLPETALQSARASALFSDCELVPDLDTPCKGSAETELTMALAGANSSYWDDYAS